jgi:hypothetical protein
MTTHLMLGATTVATYLNVAGSQNFTGPLPALIL